ncbi:hypothetical protein Tco_0895124 [Tanacetum coccineum]|uniref:Uncharacterized protein n=1 Tax=Tanacetum coccineum TaxID=301880 RepID=A0ABQ5CGK1_9ASTR
MQEGKINMGKALDNGSVVTESCRTKSDKRHTTSRSGNDADTDDAVIRPVNDQEPFAEVQLTTQHNVFANEQQHFVQSEPIYNTHLLEKVDSNTTPDSTNMCHMGGEIDQNAKKCQVSCPLLDPSSDNMTTEFSNQSLASENISLKKTVAQLQKDFSRMETHCVNMELKYQNQALKDGQHDQILNETSNKSPRLNRKIEILERSISIGRPPLVWLNFLQSMRSCIWKMSIETGLTRSYDSIKIDTSLGQRPLNNSLIVNIK